MSAEPIVSEVGIFASWGFIQWAIAGSVTALVAIGALIWRLGSKVGKYQEQFATMRLDINTKHRENTERAARFDADISKLRANDHDLERSVSGLEKTIAGLPDVIMIRLEGIFREMTRRIDDALSRRPPNSTP